MVKRNKSSRRKILISFLVVLIIFLIGLFIYMIYDKINSQQKKISENNLKLYWFIPDGMRADPELFNIYEWAENGELPNIKKMMEQGSYGYSIPPFPGHTPVGFATLLTGTYPVKNGVADGPMHVEGRPLDKVAVAGFSSVAKKVEPIWVTLEKNNKKVVLLSIPGSTPPELQEGVTIRGRWGNWGPEFHAINFESKLDLAQRKKQGKAARLFYFGAELTKYVDVKEAVNWSSNPLSFSTPLEAEMNVWGKSIYAYIYDTTNDSSINYDKIMFSPDKRIMLTKLTKDQWSQWLPITLQWEGKPVNTSFMIRVIKLDDDGFIRVRFFYNNVNAYLTQPSYVADDLTVKVGPMVDFVDNFPPQLVYYDEDKLVFQEEMNMSFDWHTKAIPFIINEYQPDVVIQDIYSPNQMLTSRWWLGYVDPNSARYNDVDEKQREILMGEVKNMYKRLDTMIGEIMKNSDENTIIVISSDHGAIPLNKYVKLNNLFAQKGWLKFKIDNMTGEPIVDWYNSTVIYLQMDNVYISPKGLGGNWTRGSGEEYEKLRDEVIQSLSELKDPETGVKPLNAVVKWEEAERLSLPKDRVGDLIVANEAGYHWNEEMNENLEVFSVPLISGYKQAVMPNDTIGMWTPFIIMGPGVKKSHYIEKPFMLVDQYPTIMNLLGINSTVPVDGVIIKEILVK